MMRCAEMKEMIPAIAGDHDMALGLRRHLSRCAGCRSELEAYESMLSELATMRYEPVAVPVGLESSLLAVAGRSGKADQLKSHVLRNRKAYAGLAVAMAGAAGAALLRSRRRVAVA